MFDKCNAATVGYVSVKHIILVNILRFRFCRWQWITTYPVNASPVLQTNYVRSFTYQTRLVDDVLKSFKFNPTLKSGQTSLHRYQWILTFIYFHITTDLFILSGTKWGLNWRYFRIGDHCHGMKLVATGQTCLPQSPNPLQWCNN